MPLWFVVSYTFTFFISVGRYNQTCYCRNYRVVNKFAFFHVTLIWLLRQSLTSRNSTSNPLDFHNRYLRPMVTGLRLQAADDTAVVHFCQTLTLVLLPDTHRGSLGGVSYTYWGATCALYTDTPHHRWTIISMHVSTVRCSVPHPTSRESILPIPSNPITSHPNFFFFQWTVFGKRY